MNAIIICAVEFVTLCMIVNASLNMLGWLKRTRHIEKIDAPFDFGKKLGKERILGESTTWLGLAVSVAIGYLIYLFFSPAGIIIGLGVFFGHAVGSFIKRRFHYPDGSYLPIIDHGDYVILTGAVLLVLGYLNFSTYMMSIAIVLAVHPVLCFLAYKSGFRERIL